MKRLIIGGISALLLAAAHAPAVTAQTAALNSATLRSTPTRALSPFNLVTFADRGYFKEQGIPSYSTLRSAYRLGQINATDIVAAAVKANRLAPGSLTDKSYLSAVEAQLSAIGNIR